MKNIFCLNCENFIDGSTAEHERLTGHTSYEKREPVQLTEIYDKDDKAELLRLAGEVDALKSYNAERDESLNRTFENQAKQIEVLREENLEIVSRFEVLKTELETQVEAEHNAVNGMKTELESIKFDLDTVKSEQKKYTAPLAHDG